MKQSGLNTRDRTERSNAQDSIFLDGTFCASRLPSNLGLYARQTATSNAELI